MSTYQCGSADSFAVHPSTAENLDVSEEQVATGTNGIRVNGSSHIGLPFLLQDKNKCFRVYGLEVLTVYHLEERILLPGLRLLTPPPSPDPISLFPQNHSSSLAVPSKLRARMVNYNDPLTIGREFGAYTLPSDFRRPHLDLTVGLFNSDAPEGLAFRGWYICVSLSALPR